VDGRDEERVAMAVFAILKVETIMKKRPSTTWIVVALLLFLLIAPNRAEAPRRPGPGKPLVFDTNTGLIRVVLVAQGLASPWSFAFLPDGRSMLVAELPGRLRIIRDGVLDPQPIAGLPRVGAEGPQGSSAGLHDVAVHPQFAQNRLVYFSYVKSGGERGGTIALGRGRLDGMTLTDVRDIFVADAWNRGGAYAGRVLFGRDGMVYLTIGDRAMGTYKTTDPFPSASQDLGSHAGKVLRLRDDGSVPPDNPFVGRPGAKPEIFTYGHRNGYGLAVHPETGELWELEIGPMGGDEVNVLLPGRNYGWPLVSLGRTYAGTLVSDQPWWRPDMEMPRMFWVPAISPSGMTFYTGDRFPRWKGNLFVGALSGKQLQRIVFNQPGQAERRESLLTQLDLRFRDVRQGPDGYLYVTTDVCVSACATRNDLDGSILRIEPGE
jgi:glucose/arabinose dehydrogenase